MKKTIYSPREKKGIGLIFILLGTICAIDATLELIGIRTKLLTDSEFYGPFMEIAKLVPWILLAIVLKRIERIASILKIIQLLSYLIVLPKLMLTDHFGLFIQITSAIGSLAYVLFIMSKSLSPFKIPATTFLISALWYVAISTISHITKSGEIAVILPIPRLFFLAGSIITIVSFCKWNYDEPTAIYINEEPN